MKNVFLPAIIACLAITANHVDCKISNLNTYVYVNKLMIWDPSTLFTEAFKYLSTIENRTEMEFLLCTFTRTNKAHRVIKQIENAERKQDVQDGIRSYCNIGLDVCWKNLTPKLSGCLKGNLTVPLTDLNNIVGNSTSYDCEKNRLLDFVMANGTNCTMSEDRMAAVSNCVEPHVQKYRRAMRTLLDVSFNRPMCLLMRRVRECVVSELRKCNNQAAAKYVDDYLDRMNDVTRLHLQIIVLIFTIILLSKYLESALQTVFN